ncbi:MAG: putative toxin-antitoxin system toxin component, PIN family [Patescibacteria group bacterium]
MLKVVFDTVVFVRSLINPYSRYGQIVFKYHKYFRLFVSKQVIIEILEVLKRPELTKKFSSIEKMDMREAIKIISQAEIVEVGEFPKASRDPKDNKFIDAAIVSSADYLVSEDNDLLVLKEYQGIKIVNCEQFLLVLKA